MSKKKVFFRKGIVFISLAFLLPHFFILPASANSAQTHWSGTAAAGVIITDETCPVIVENEKLTFDLQEFPKRDTKEISDYLSYTGKVHAEYTFYNPADYTVNAVLVFPFGKVPDYGYFHDTETGKRILNADTEKYHITVNGKVIHKTLRHTLSSWDSQFELSNDMALLQDSYVDDECYSPDMPVTRYTYVPDNVDTETYNAANAGMEVL